MRRSSFLKGTVLAACFTAGSAFASIPIIKVSSTHQTIAEDIFTQNKQ
ncbi:hypothetical protein POL68_10590 [Stigmatella sp. ncwal1]|uniref:Uncharacterized protein n=1 Tax=Stigmatella ashevillensis TaxID=2995309 RepID=A0ABT5D5G9_9BACT|nr:hypothetical protein [Stigmatella ashevillena]MDC0708914.1 hypothetical protein [Stigmatella ashevillena]